MKCRIQAFFALILSPLLFPVLFIWYRRRDFLILLRDYVDGCWDALRYGDNDGDCDGLKP